MNLTKLESRPTKRGLGDYCFFIDCEGHVSDEVVADALRNLAAKQGEVKFLGSYPVGGPVEAGVARRKAVGQGVEAGVGVGRGAARADPGRRRVIDLKRLRDEPEYRRGIERKRVRDGPDRRRARGSTPRTARSWHEVEALRARQNAASKEIGKAAPDERPAKIEAAAALKDELQPSEEQALPAADAQLRELALQVPNPADASVPDGGEDDGEVAQASSATTTDAPPLDHAAFAEAMGFVDTARGAEASGSRFAYIMREAALLELALVNYAMSTVVRHGFTPVITPTLVRERTMEEAGFFPTDRAQVYDVDDGELFLVGTSEVAALGAAPRRDVRARRAARALRGLLDVLPARGRHVRQGHARHLPRAPVRQGRDVLVLRTRRVVRRARAHPRDRRGDHRRARAAVPRREHRGRRSRSRRREEVRHRGVAAVGRRSTASSRRARTTPTTPPAGSARG